MFAALQAMGLDAELRVDPRSAGRTYAELSERLTRETAAYDVPRLVREAAERVAPVFAASCGTHFLDVPVADGAAGVREAVAYGLRRLVSVDNGCVAEGRRFGWVWLTWPCEISPVGVVPPHVVRVPSLLLFDGVHRELQEWDPVPVAHPPHKEQTQKKTTGTGR